MFTYIQLPLFTKDETQLETRKDKWLYFLKNLENMEKNITELFHEDKIFNKVLTIAEIANLTPEDARKYDISRNQYLEIKGIADTAYDEGLQDAEEKYFEMINELKAEIKQAGLKAEEERKQKEEERKQKEEAEAKAEEERKQKEEAEAKAEEERKQKEEAEAKAEEERKQKEDFMILFVTTLYNSGKSAAEINSMTQIPLLEIENIIKTIQDK
jgi:FtsZ-interacting cell division protein ZipA